MPQYEAQGAAARCGPNSVDTDFDGHGTSFGKDSGNFSGLYLVAGRGGRGQNPLIPYVSD